MKNVLLASLVILIASCSKSEIDLSGGPAGWGGFTPKEDTTNKVQADITAGGNTTHLAAKGFGTSFSRYVMTLIDSSVVSVSASDSVGSLYINLHNILASGTYNFGLNPGRGKEVKATYYKSQGPGIPIAYLNDSTITSGTINITTFTDRKIEGTFSVTCRNGNQSVVITNAVFKGNF